MSDRRPEHYRPENTVGKFIKNNLTLIILAAIIVALFFYFSKVGVWVLIAALFLMAYLYLYDGRTGQEDEWNARINHMIGIGRHKQAPQPQAPVNNQQQPQQQQTYVQQPQANYKYRGRVKRSAWSFVGILASGVDIWAAYSLPMFNIGPIISQLPFGNVIIAYMNQEHFEQSTPLFGINDFISKMNNIANMASQYGISNVSEFTKNLSEIQSVVGILMVLTFVPIVAFLFKNRLMNLIAFLASGGSAVVYGLLYQSLNKPIQGINPAQTIFGQGFYIMLGANVVIALVAFIMFFQRRRRV